MSRPSAILNAPWDDRARQREAMRFGVWLFLAGEILFFGGLLLVYAVARYVDPEGFLAGARETDAAYGFANTIILLTSSCAMTIAERAAKQGLERVASAGLWIAFTLGAAFLAVKGFEYRQDLQENLFPSGRAFRLDQAGAARFWAFYWVATLVHMAHLIAGLGLIGRLIALGGLERGVGRRWMAVEATSFYWHFVDAVWIVLFPLLYLAGKGG